MQFQAYHDPDDEPTAEPIDPSFFDFDSAIPLGKEKLKGECVDYSQKLSTLTYIRLAQF
jgi:hypothetical protein